MAQDAEGPVEKWKPSALFPGLTLGTGAESIKVCTRNHIQAQEEARGLESIKVSQEEERRAGMQKNIRRKKSGEPKSRKTSAGSNYRLLNSQPQYS